MRVERRQKIREWLDQRGSVSLKELEAFFTDVSSMTLRRDLESFALSGEAVRVKGGIRAVDSFVPARAEEVYTTRLAQNPEAKQRIASLAVSYIETGRSLFLDSGTTMMRLAAQLPDTNLSILTSSPYIALEVSKKFRPSVYLIGGQVGRDSLSVSGLQALSFVKTCNFDIAFMVPSAFSPETGFTCGNYNECALKRQIVAKAAKTIVMVDASKFQRSLPFTFASLSEVDVVLTNQKPSEQVLSAACAQNVLVRWE